MSDPVLTNAAQAAAIGRHHAELAAERCTLPSAAEALRRLTDQPTQARRFAELLWEHRTRWEPQMADRFGWAVNASRFAELLDVYVTAFAAEHAQLLAARASAELARRS